MPSAPVPQPADSRARVVVLGREGCHLCEVAEDLVAQVCAELGETWEQVSLDGSPELLSAYADQIPVTFVDGRFHDYWRVTPERLRAALRPRNLSL